MTLPPPQFSEDGHLWWDGGQWLPAASAPLVQPTSYGPPPAYAGVAATPLAGAVSTELLPDESVLREASLHWWSACWPAAGLFGIGLMYAPVLLMVSGGAALAAMLFWSIPALLALAVGKLRRDLSSFVLTDQRLLVKQGVLRRSSAELLLRQVESATVTQSVVSGLLGYGDVVVTGTGGHSQVLRGVLEPQDFRSQLQRAVASAQR